MEKRIRGQVEKPSLRTITLREERKRKKKTILIRKSNILDQGKSKYNPLKQINTKIFRRLIIELVWVE